MKPTRRILPRIYFNRPTLTVARSLVGKYLIRCIDGREIAGKIIEVEAYVGSEDKACHASKGRTQRTDVMFGPAGIAYVYFIYGMYHCLNVVTEREECPSAVLIRAIELDGKLIDGPGRLCRAMQIDRSHSGRIPLVRGSRGIGEERSCRGSSSNRCGLCGCLGQEALAIPAANAHGFYSDSTHKKTGGTG
jgi:DNA-3-methyladenine glycosylase